MKNVKISRDLSSLTKEQMERQMMQMFAIMDELEAKVSWYEEQYRLSRAQRFGPSSEQTLPFDQMSFFNEAESESSPLIAKEPELSQVEIPRKGKKKGFWHIRRS